MQEDAFKHIKANAFRMLALTFYHPQGVLTVFADISSCGFEVVLHQEDSNRKHLPAAYTSRVFTEAEKRQAKTEQEVQQSLAHVSTFEYI